MAHKAPGKHYRAGLTLIEPRMFPNDAAAERWSSQNALAGWRALPVLWLSERAGTQDTEASALSLSGLPQGFLGQARPLMEGSKLGFQIWAMAIYLMDGAQGYVQHEAPP